MAEYFVHGKISYSTPTGASSARTSIENVFINNAASVVAQSIGGLAAGTTMPDASSVSFSYRVINNAAAVLVNAQLATAIASQPRSTTLGSWASTVKATP